jgi:hypothetical protein
VDFGIAGVCVGSKKDKIDAGSIAYMAPEVSIICIIIVGIQSWK